MTRVLVRLSAALFLSIAVSVHAAERGDIDRQAWSETTFERARRENRFVLLDLEAVWCHWCHVMDRTTYRNPKVVQVIGSQFIAVKVDQDSHPALSRRYEEYGWPATVVFGPDGTEIAKRRGYLKPDIMLSYLEAVLADPSPVRYRDSEPVREFASSPLLAERLRTELEARHLIKGQHSAGYFALRDAARVKRGVPAVDKNRYARKNGWMIYALATFHAATGDATALAQAIRAAHWVLAKRALPGGGFAHGERDRGRPFLEDTVAMGRALVALYQATGEREWLRHAEAAAGFIERHFVNADAAGYLSTPKTESAVLPARPQVDENVAVARLNILLAHLTGKPEYRKRADHAMRLLAG